MADRYDYDRSIPFALGKSFTGTALCTPFGVQGLRAKGAGDGLRARRRRSDGKVLLSRRSNGASGRLCDVTGMNAGGDQKSRHHIVGGRNPAQLNDLAIA